MSEFMVVQTTFESKEDAEKLADVIISKKLAACCQIDGPITSVYWWKGKTEKETEWRASFKTKSNLYTPLESAIKEIHPYETPEIIAMQIANGSPEYLDWLKNETVSAS